MITTAPEVTEFLSPFQEVESALKIYLPEPEHKRNFNFIASDLDTVNCQALSISLSISIYLSITQSHFISLYISEIEIELTL